MIFSLTRINATLKNLKKQYFIKNVTLYALNQVQFLRLKPTQRLLLNRFTNLQKNVLLAKKNSYLVIN